MSSIKLKIKDFLYNLLSTSWFTELEDGKIIKLEVLLLYMGFAGLLGGIGLGYDVSHGFEFSTAYTLLLVPFMLGALIWFTKDFTVGIVPKQIQDKYWKTQLFRFLDVRFAFQKSLYPNSDERLEELKEQWNASHDLTIDEVIENPPLLQKIRFLIVVILPALGLAIGMIL